MVPFSKSCVVILALISACSFGGCYSKNKAKRFNAISDINLLNKSLEMYVTENGSLPKIAATASPEGANAAVVKELLNINKIRNSPYIEVPRVHLDSKGALLDPWGTPYLVILGSQSKVGVQVGDQSLNQKWAIWSCGKNKINEWGRGDDICGWK